MVYYIKSVYLKECVNMIKIKNHLGSIGVSNSYLRTLVSKTAESCFGVVAMNTYGAKQGVSQLIQRNKAKNQGVIICQKSSGLSIDLHITVTYGVNVNAIVKSIVHKVEFVLDEQAGIRPLAVNVYVDNMVN